jgi:hypothetical protein
MATQTSGLGLGVILAGFFSRAVFCLDSFSLDGANQDTDIKRIRGAGAWREHLLDDGQTKCARCGSS